MLFPCGVLKWFVVGIWTIELEGCFHSNCHILNKISCNSSNLFKALGTHLKNIKLALTQTYSGQLRCYIHFASSKTMHRVNISTTL